MPLADYAHWNEEAPRIWWEEEGRHDGRDDPPEPDDDFDPRGDAMDAFAQDLYEQSEETLNGMLEDGDYLDRLPPQAEKIIRDVMAERGFVV